MDFDDALDLLGLDRSSDWAAVRGAYRASMRHAHPDVATGDAVIARRLNEAFALLEPVFRRGEPAPPPPAPPPPARAAAPRAAWGDELDVARVDDDALALVAPAEEVFLRLLDALHELGDVTYADPENGYLEALVCDGDGLLAVSLQGRAEATEAFFTLESLRGSPVPPIERVVREVADVLRARA
jgi:hypothetical protein